MGSLATCRIWRMRNAFPSFYSRHCVCVTQGYDDACIVECNSTGDFPERRDHGVGGEGRLKRVHLYICLLIAEKYSTAGTRRGRSTRTECSRRTERREGRAGQQWREGSPAGRGRGAEPIPVGGRFACFHVYAIFNLCSLFEETQGARGEEEAGERGSNTL